ncbi:structural maintenance of chromosomes protein 6 [Engraulis encrasicolus]|uniref:structural maintenance of chromosomes protein 6 n=1 Tax=Engraulis encrasicolus TaxID=184585 RepID=UPI002FD13AEC
MNKRKSKTKPEAKPSKSLKVDRRSTQEDDFEDDDGLEDHSFSTSSLGDIGVIESITLKNFMCHQNLGPFQFGPNVNFIVGNNGSGKSAILTALIVGLGGKATMTNRGVSLKGFVKNGEGHADVTVKLRNRGIDAFKGEVYGDCIIVEQRIANDGCRLCKIKNKSGQIISNKKEELMSILDHFNIQVDNPVSILNQEMSKQFLHSKSEADKYKFFMKATLLEQMRRDYIHIKQTEDVTRDQVERQEECLKDLRQDYVLKKERYDSLASLDEMKKTLEGLQRKMAWCLVREKEWQIEHLKEQIEKEGDGKFEEKLLLCQAKVTQAMKKVRDIQKKLEKVRDEDTSLTRDYQRFKEEVKAKSKEQKGQEVVYFRAENKLKQLEKEQCLLSERIHKIKHNESQNVEVERNKRLKKMAALKKLLEKHEAQSAALNQELKDKQQALFKGREEFDKLSMEEKNIKVALEAKLKRKNQLLASRSNRLRMFGERMPELIESINKAHAQGRFKHKPVGPIGACISVKEPSLTVAVESCLRGFMKTFCCDNYRDEKVLEELMAPHFQRSSRPQIIVCPFTENVYNVQGRGVKHPEFPSVLDMISCTSPVVTNCLIDMRGIECILIIKDTAMARKVMMLNRPPRNCREAFTAEGDQVYTNRSYAPEKNVLIKYLGGDPEAEIRLVEAEVENHRAQLSRFQLHLSSVKQDIQAMEDKMNSVIITCKKNQASINQVKTSISELENVEESQVEDISTLEEDAQEIQQKIELEKKNVEKTKTELDKQEEALKDVNGKFQNVKNKMEELTDDTDQLKEEQVKGEAECSKLEQTLKILEKKAKAHEENIQTIRSELTAKEEDIQECIEKAKLICPERLSVDRSTKSLDTEITRLRQKITAQEQSHGDKDKVIREYAEAHENYKSKSSQLRDLKKFIDCLDNIMTDRQARYKTLRRSLSVRCKLYFNNFLIKLQCCGSMKFDHNNETLSISVKPPGQESDSVSDMRSLSGGERSFSTVCFILSLWEITESPFRCLDEFDVYMDMHNRRISLDLLLELSERQHLRQFIFITPQTTSNLPKSDHIKIHQLEDPERGGIEDEEVSRSRR